MAVTGQLHFVGFIDEDDGTTTLECVDDAGVVHEFRNVKVTDAGYSTEADDVETIKLDIKVS